MSKFYIGTEAYYGENVLKTNKNLFKDIGKKALIVTGATSGYVSGALKDMTDILDELEIEYSVYNKVKNNPSLENVNDGGIFAKEEGADFIIGIGGGSPLDASKAIAVLATNDIKPLDLFKNKFKNKPLPIVAIPTTAGTGSEITPYSILTRDDLKTKMSFGNKETYPLFAIVDYKYTTMLDYNITVNTAVDAFTHLMEGYLSKRSTPISDVLALEGMGIFGEVLNNLTFNRIDKDVRKKLIYMSMLGGMVISHTGTTIIHGMGYSLTYFKNIPHGRANGILVAEYLKYNYDYAKNKIDNILNKLNLRTLNEVKDIFNTLLKNDLKVSEKELKDYSKITMIQRSTKLNIKEVTQDDLYEIMVKSLNN
jgi:alcohol dehydrogenase class IV